MKFVVALMTIGLTAVSSRAAGANVSDCKQGYALVDRSLEIARRASNPSDTAIGSLIASDAKFELARGDTIDNFRDLSGGVGTNLLSGVPAARAFFSRIDSKSFVVRKSIGPYCAKEAKTAVIEFISANGKESVDTTFTFEGARLQRVRGNAQVYEQGNLTGNNR